ncbi:hypothetical protein ES706_04092 [subsurface metagenome]
MKTCQIMIYGGKHYWIDLAHRKDPDIRWFIFIGVEPEREFPRHWEMIEDKIQEFEQLQKDFPDSEKIKYLYIKLEPQEKLVSLIRYFRAIINFIYEKGYQVSCNLTAGIFELRMALYLASQIESDKIVEGFYFNKQNFEKNLLFKSIEISKKGKKILNIMYENIKNQSNNEIEVQFHEIEYNLSQLRELCEKSHFKIDLPTISRVVSKLIEEGYLKERREGRNKFISLTDIGLIFCPVYNDLEKIKVTLQMEE